MVVSIEVLKAFHFRSDPAVKDLVAVGIFVTICKRLPWRQRGPGVLTNRFNAKHVEHPVRPPLILQVLERPQKRPRPSAIPRPSMTPHLLRQGWAAILDEISNALVMRRSRI